MSSTRFAHLCSARSVVVLVGCLTLACAGGQIDDGEGGKFETSETAGDGDGDSDEEEPTDDDAPTGDGDGDPACTSIGCDCDGSLDSCDIGLACVAGVCSSPTCGNGITEAPAEECDDGNDFEGDGCNNDCSFTTVLAVEAGAAHTCALIEGGRVRCWGLNNAGQLGYGNTHNIGDNEPASTPGDVVLGEKASQISSRAHHTCAHLFDQSVRCWGYNGSGQLGQGNLEHIGDDEFPFSVNPLTINASILDIAAGGYHTCARVGSGTVRCWGEASSGQLGYGNTTQLTIPLTVDVNLGGTVAMLSAGVDHNCALLDDGKVRCWGRNDHGQLGYGNTNNIGDNEVPGLVVPVPIMPKGIADGTPILALALGDSHSCALFETGDQAGVVLCWGDNFYGQLGQGNTTTIGDNETLATLYPIDLGGDAVALALGKHHTCALLDDGDLKCWGRNLYGQLGRGDIAHIGDDEVPADVPPIDLGGVATSITAGDYHTCAVVDGHEVVCWGFNDYGQLGYGDTALRGHEQVPAELGPIDLL
jgi:cysteine-rich repeat protein